MVADGDSEHDQSGCDAGHLTRRQIEVLAAIAQGLPSKKIAEVLNISVNTVNTHVKDMMRLAGIGKRVELVSLAVAQLVLDGTVHPPKPTGQTCFRSRTQLEPP